jgi:photosystem II stability/assembly factor-like uncharacterized protein
MEKEAPQGISQRGKRALRVIAVAAIVIVASSFAWLLPTIAPKTAPAPPPAPAPLPTTKPGELITYQFFNPLVGWAAGIAMYGPSNSGLGEFWVARTVDGAKHWKTVLRGRVNPDYGASSPVQFVDEKRGFIGFGRPLELRRTVDAGASWTTVRIPDAEATLTTFSDSRHGWLLAGAYPSGGEPTRLYGTSDAGDSWQRLPNPPDQSLRLAFRSQQEGWLQTLGNRIYISRDGGQSWQGSKVPEPPPPRSSQQTLVVAGLRLLPRIGVVASVAYSEGRGYVLPIYDFTSFDMGTTWTYAPPALQNQDPRFGWSESFEDAMHWWGVVGANLYKSSDAGQTWTPVPVQLENGDNWRYAIQVLDSKHAWAQLWMGQTTGLAMTSDGGLHWTRANVPEPAS